MGHVNAGTVDDIKAVPGSVVLWIFVYPHLSA